MIATYSLDNEKQMQEWNQFVISHPDGTPFHSSHWLQCIQKTYQYKPLLYIFRNNSHGIDGIFPCFHIKSFITGSRVVSIPFSDYGGPLFFDKSKETDLLLNIIKNFNGKDKYLEVRSSVNDCSGFSQHNLFKLHTLKLCPEPELIRKNFDKRTTQYSIRKAGREGVKIKEENTLKGIEAFYKLNTLTRKKHGLPPQPFAFIKNIYKILILNKKASLFLAIHDSKVIAAGIFIKFKDTVYYKYNASDPAFLSREKPNHLLTWHAIEQACGEGFQCFDFGRTAVNNPGLSRYKEMWGAQSIDLPYHFYPEIQGATATDEAQLSYRIFTRICKNLPDVLLKQLGAKLYKHIG